MMKQNPKKSTANIPSSVDPEKYSAFIQELEICGLTFPNMSWRLTELPPRDHELEEEIELEINDPIISEEQKEITIPATLLVRAKEKKSEKVFMEISMHQHLTISINPEHYSDEILEAYIYRNAILNLVSVFREHVKYATFQMGLPPLILPAVKIIPKRKSNSSTKNSNH